MKSQIGQALIAQKRCLNCAHWQHDPNQTVRAMGYCLHPDRDARCLLTESAHCCALFERRAPLSVRALAQKHGIDLNRIQDQQDAIDQEMSLNE